MEDKKLRKRFGMEEKNEEEKDNSFIDSTDNGGRDSDRMWSRGR